MRCPFLGFPSGTSKARPTLVIFVKPWTLLNWAELEALLRNIWPHTNMLIEVLPGCVEEQPGIALGSRIKRYPEMGASIGQKGKPGEGTLGGFVILKQGSISRSGFLNCHHVVKPHDDVPLKTGEEMDRYGYGSHNPGVVTNIQYPALKDLKASEEYINTSVMLWEYEIAEVEASLEKLTMQDIAEPESHIERLKIAKIALKERQDHREEFMKILPVQWAKCFIRREKW